METNHMMGIKRVSIAEVISALDSQIAVGAILIGNNVNASEIARLHFSEEQEDEDTINKLKTDYLVLYFFGQEDCPIGMDAQVDLLVVERLYIVKLI